MNKYTKFYTMYRISQLVLLLLTAVSLYILRYVYLMKDSAEIFLSGYNSVPYMLEHVLSGLLVYLVFAVIITKIHNKNMYGGG